MKTSEEAWKDYMDTHKKRSEIWEQYERLQELCEEKSKNFYELRQLESNTPHCI